MTFIQFLNDCAAHGYRVKMIDQKLHRGYVSRKTLMGDCQVYPAGGTRIGLYYVALPNYRTTRYYTRQYMRVIPVSDDIPDWGDLI